MARVVCLLVLVLAAGCPGGGGDDYPIGAGGGGGGPTTPGASKDAAVEDASQRDAAIDAPPGQLIGRVCLLTDLRLINAAPGDCAATGASNLRVTLGSSAPVLTNDDGTFLIAEQAGSNLAWTVTGVTLVTSVIPFSTSRLLPAIRDTAYGDLKSSSSVIVSPGEGSIVARLVKNNASITGARALVNNGESLQTLYDTANATVWGTQGTGSLGVAWLPNNLAGTRTLIVSPPSGASFAVPVTIVDQAITFVTIAVP
ncbi:MAG TPA: hypothetical protein VN253_19300 [Kofleriaceae bacterium]|nr:hypothetical protein [Kofleriaceae bacterium]